MELVNIAGLTRDLDEVLIKLSECNCFHIEEASKLTGNEKKFSSAKEENPYIPVLKLLSELSAKTGIKYEHADFSDIEKLSINKLVQVVRGIQKDVFNLIENKKAAEEVLREYNVACEQVEHLRGFNADFQQVFSCSNIKVRFGKLPIDSYEKLPYYDDKIFMFSRFSEEKEYYWGLYFTPVTSHEEVDEIFQSLYFERIYIADFVHGNCEDAVSDLHKIIEQKKESIVNYTNQIEEILTSKKETLDKIFSRFKSQHDNFDLRNKAAITNDKFYIVGFIPHSEADNFMKLFDDMTSVSVVMQPADANGKLRPPIKLRNNKFSEPFSMFVNMYGLPAYNGINPTTFIAITYTLLFGLMFGDLGQGFLLSLLGALLWKFKKFALGPIMVRIGISSMIFGTLYGSVFGFETLLNPMYEAIGISFLPFSPMHNTMTVLIGAIALGVLIIVISILINIFRGLFCKDFESALFSNNGLAGLIFYGGILAGLISTFVSPEKTLFTTPYIIFLIVIPFAMMFLREPLSYWVRGKKFTCHDGVGTFITSNFFEMFEFLLGYATNTLSFVRVGGFILSHAGMMSVVMLLSETASGGGSIVIVIIGNLFVMGLEGLVVGIQTLRLEFYEMFSRFYKSDGDPFVPVQIKYDNDIL